MFGQTLDFGPWEINNYGYLLGLISGIDPEIYVLSWGPPAVAFNKKSHVSKNGHGYSSFQNYHVC